jgi:aminoglycoside phosphotransferase (APT) family kinase protein
LSVPIDDLPAAAARASLALRQELLAIFGDDLAAMWVHGGTTFPDRPRVPGDLDICVVLNGVAPNERRRPRWADDPSSRPRRVEAAEQTINESLGVQVDSMYLLRDELGRPSPTSAFRELRRAGGWPVCNLHWLAGQYVLLHGPPPEELGLRVPARLELEWALASEVEHLERHVSGGDAGDPYEATYAVWNGCRILYTLATGSPVISKRSAGAWGLENIPPRWHAAIHAAGRSYDGAAATADNEVLRTNMAPFVEMVRKHLPPRTSPPRGARMHAEEIDIDDSLVRRLVTTQLPEWATLPIERVPSTGTVNAIFRLGADMAIRLPRTTGTDDTAEDCWLRHLTTARLPVAVPEPLAAGEPDEGYPMPWSVHGWVEGDTWRMDRLDDPPEASSHLAAFITALQRLDPTGVACAPLAPTWPLSVHDVHVREAAAVHTSGIDRGAFLAAWDAALEIPEWDGDPVLVHHDLLPGNVLTRDGRVSAVIDWGYLSYGDPARDLSAAWTLFSGEARRVFRASLPGYDANTWARAKAWLLTGIRGAAYYTDTNPTLAEENRRRVMVALDDD